MPEATSRKKRKRKVTIETRRKKEFSYKGHSLEELKAMSLEDIIKLLPARGRRSFARGLNEEQRTLIEHIRPSRAGSTRSRGPSSSTSARRIR
jgi:small subunit ribosomal protein S19